MTFDLPIKTRSLNAMLASGLRARIGSKRKERELARLLTANELRRVACMEGLASSLGIVPTMVMLERMGGRKMDTGNLSGAMKHVQDGIAMALFPGTRPGEADDRLGWVYGQQPGGKLLGVRVTLIWG